MSTLVFVAAVILGISGILCALVYIWLNAFSKISDAADRNSFAISMIIFFAASTVIFRLVVLLVCRIRSYFQYYVFCSNLFCVCCSGLVCGIGALCCHGNLFDGIKNTFQEKGNAGTKEACNNCYSGNSSTVVFILVIYLRVKSVFQNPFRIRFSYVFNAKGL